MSTYWSTGADFTLMKDSYRPPAATSRIIEIPILSSTSSAWQAASIIQHGGRGSKRTSFSGHVPTWTQYAALHDDWVAATERSWVGPETTTGLNMVIEKLSPPHRLLSDDIRFDCTLVEVAT